MSELFEFRTEDLVSEVTAKELLFPFFGEFTSIWHRAWELYAQVPEEIRGRLAETSFIPAVNIFGLAQSLAKETFSNRENEGLVVCNELGVFGVYVEEKLLLRFNTLDSNHLVHNTQCKTSTERREQYYAQEPIYGINNSATRLTIGGIANAAKTGLESVVVSCQVGDSLHYSFSTDNADGAVIAGPAGTVSPQPGNITDNLDIRKPR